MGYYVRYEGEFKFTGSALPVRTLKRLYTPGDIFASNDWDIKTFTKTKNSRDTKSFLHTIHTYSLRLNEDWNGLIAHDDEVKSDYLLETLKVVLHEVRKDVPDFGLEGEVLATGEDGEKWKVKIVNGEPVIVNLIAIEFDPTKEIIVKKPFFDYLIKNLYVKETNLENKIKINTRTK